MGSPWREEQKRGRICGVLTGSLAPKWEVDYKEKGKSEKKL